MAPESVRPLFSEVWEQADTIKGWLTRRQGAVLFDASSELAAGAHVVEIGSHRGRSTVILAARRDLRVTAIDPFVAGRLFGGPATRHDFAANLAAAGVDTRVRLLMHPSVRLRPTWTESIDLLYIDGKHDYWTVGDDLRWAAFVRPGGYVLVHDCFSSIGVTLAVLRHVLPGRNLTYEGREGSLATFTVSKPTRASRRAMLAQLPWWQRNVGIKVLLRLHLRQVARIVGHHDRFDPY